MLDRISRRGFDVALPSKKNVGGTLSTSAICCNLLAPIRLLTFSYFWNCWKVIPIASASARLAHIHGLA